MMSITNERVEHSLQISFPEILGSSLSFNSVVVYRNNDYKTTDKSCLATFLARFPDVSKDTLLRKH